MSCLWAGEMSGTSLGLFLFLFPFSRKKLRGKSSLEKNCCGHRVFNGVGIFSLGKVQKSEDTVCMA
jgi:hypothetical protein